MKTTQMIALHRIESLQKFKIVFEKIKNAKIAYYNDNKYFVSQEKRMVERKVA